MTDARDDRLNAMYAAGTAGQEFTAHPDPEALAAATERRGPEEARLVTLDHVALCVPCRREFELLRAAHVAGRRLVAHAWRVRGAALAAAAVLIAAVSLSVGRLGPGRGDGIPAERGGTPGGAEHAIVLIAPAQQASTVASPVLTWHAVAGAASYRVEVLDSAGAVVASRDTPDTLLMIPPLTPGRSYHWWVRADANGQEWRSMFSAFSTRPKT